ncbi:MULTISPECIES: histone deacetylase family protein [Salinibaculum]|uniref:histone deacetylase family protein n=1 Tax=Salinibaculum TaxID=2732368 RepID=UPI0030D26617
MRFGHRAACLDHDPGPRHPESPNRVRAIRQALADADSAEYVAAEPATREQVLAVHDEDYVAEFQRFCANGGGSWDADTTAVERTWEAALASAGLAIWSARRAVAGDDGTRTPFSLGRPPGHHAPADDARGFCFLNNVAIAAQSVLDAGLADRVAIVDWDIHHGNGTQDIFYDRADVYYASIHERDSYPPSGYIHETGTGDGEGATLNIAFPAGTTHSAYLAALDEVVGPALERFDPDVVLVSAGFDGHEYDPISQQRISTDGYTLLAERVRSIATDCGAGLGFVLEGGYDLEMLAESVRAVDAFFERERPAEDSAAVLDGAREVIDRARKQVERV